jgi:hypothetical protein
MRAWNPASNGSSAATYRPFFEPKYWKTRPWETPIRSAMSSIETSS